MLAGKIRQNTARDRSRETKTERADSNKSAKQLAENSSQKLPPSIILCSQVLAAACPPLDPALLPPPSARSPCSSSISSPPGPSASAPSARTFSTKSPPVSTQRRVGRGLEYGESHPSPDHPQRQTGVLSETLCFKTEPKSGVIGAYGDPSITPRRGPSSWGDRASSATSFLRFRLRIWAK